MIENDSFAQTVRGCCAHIFAVLFLSGALAMAQNAEPHPAAATLNPQFTQYIQQGLLSKAAANAGDGATTAPARFTGLTPTPLNLSHLALSPAVIPQQSALPSSYDLRSLGKIGPVKNQLRCGDCWAFAAVASLESSLLPGESWNFSENHLNTQLSSYNTVNGFDYAICGGGDGVMSTAYLARWSGPLTAAQDPDPTSCKDDDTCFNPSPSGLTPAKHVQDVIFIPKRSGPLDNDALKSALFNNGALFIVLSADMLVKDDPYWNSSTHSYYYDGSPVCDGAVCPIDHAVALAGWDDNYPASNFKTAPPGNGAFLLKNSWGSSWGANGYFWISYYDTGLATDTSYSFRGAESPENHTTQYAYDPFGWVNSIGYSSPTAWMANLFTPAKSGQLTAIATYATANNASYTVQIYQNAGNGPTSGALAATTSGSLPYAGYHTIVLPRPVQVTAGQPFSVVVQMTTPGYNYPIPYQYALAAYSSKATASAGRSFTSSSGLSWSDITSLDATASVNLKAFVNEPSSLSTLTITPSAVDTGSTATVALKLATVAPANGATVALQSSNSAVFPTPSSITVPAGESSVSFPVQAGAVSALTTATVTGTAVASQQATVTVLPKAAAPTFSPAAGAYTTPQSVTLSSATGGATIYYTTDGATPTTGSPVYSAPLVIGSDMTLKAAARAANYALSETTTAAYLFVHPAPSLTGLSNWTGVKGAASLALTVSGSNFLNGATVTWGSTALATTFVSATQLQATVPAAALAAAGDVSVTVQNPAPSAGPSNALLFHIDASSAYAPHFTTTSATVTAGATASYAVTLPASLSNVSLRCLNLPSGAACSYSAATQTLSITTTGVAPGLYQITAVFTGLTSDSSAGWILLPLLLLPLAATRKRLQARGQWLLALPLLLLLGAATLCVGCGGSPAQQAQASGSAVISLTVN